MPRHLALCRCTCVEHSMRSNNKLVNMKILCTLKVHAQLKQIFYLLHSNCLYFSLHFQINSTATLLNLNVSHFIFISSLWVLPFGLIKNIFQQIFTKNANFGVVYFFVPSKLFYTSSITASV